MGIETSGIKRKLFIETLTEELPTVVDLSETEFGNEGESHQYSSFLCKELNELCGNQVPFYQ